MNGVAEPLTDRDLMVKGFRTLAETFGTVNAERFITLVIREPRDYTEWRSRNMYVGEDVHSIANRARESGQRLREKFGLTPTQGESVRPVPE